MDITSVKPAHPGLPNIQQRPAVVQAGPDGGRGGNDGDPDDKAAALNAALSQDPGLGKVIDKLA